TSCPDGCCNGNICVTTPGMATCGKGGGPCKTCITGQRCDGANCVCDSMSCTGCCDGNKECKTNGPLTCGTSGAPCAMCTATQQCSGSGQCVCNAASCSTGCCVGDTCVPYTGQSDTSCGTGGMMCGQCAAGKSCSKSNNACVTWCGTKAIPSGVAAADYQCVDFDVGLPAQSTWARVTAATGTLALSTTKASSPPNSLQTVAPAPDGVNQVPREGYLQWTVPGTASTIKSVSVAAAINPVVPSFSPAWTDEVDVLCVGFPGSGITSRACLAYTYASNKPWNTSYTGLFVHYTYFLGDAGYTGECAVAGNFGTNLWTNAELRIDMTTGTIDALIDGASSPCTTQMAPSPDTQAFFNVGSLSGTYVDFAWSAQFDNVIAFLRR
ncbi:MAG TPA: hypothetical protein VK550_32050, partial [Polyangiaceae bacterium]|nr:hypothetical protein [Polyangiaceae bacterium]